MLRFFMVAIGLTCWQMADAQNLYMPRDIKAAYKNETRSADGRPGKNYWQNHGIYDITMTVNPPSREIYGEESITYINNSPDTLKNPSIKLFLNIHKPGAPRGNGAMPEYLTSGVHIDEVSINGEAFEWNENPRSYTNQSLKLPTPLPSKDTLNIHFKWHYEISLQAGREGMIDSTTFFLAYFYPRVAVYDDFHGWDRMTFTDSQEFYSDFNDYKVTINVPENFIVWGTGTLLHPESLLQPEILKRYQKSMTADETIHVATIDDIRKQNITTANEQNSWTFEATNIPDMAFGLSDHYLWDASSVIVDSSTGRRASVQAAYDEEAIDFQEMVGYGQQSLAWLSSSWPGIPYPYEKTTIFQGGAGMEYPMMANDESYQDAMFANLVAHHEIAHTYMPFYMGINETRFGFMDEGWATTFEYLKLKDQYGQEVTDKIYKMFRVAGWITNTNAEGDIPIITPGNMLSGRGLGINQYGKASLGYLAMKDVLGDDLFKKCLQTYMERWNGKHPIPWDFFYSFNDAAGKNLNWFWDNWFFSMNYIDVALEDVRSKKGTVSITLENVGGMVIPFDLNVTFADGSTETIHQTPAIWKENPKEAVIALKTKKEVTEVRVETGIWMDADEGSNIWTAN